MVAEVGLEPHGLRVMSPTSYQLLHSAIYGAGDRGRTGTLLSQHWILSPRRLPVPPHRLGKRNAKPFFHCLYIISHLGRLVNPFLKKISHLRNFPQKAPRRHLRVPPSGHYQPLPATRFPLSLRYCASASTQSVWIISNPWSASQPQPCAGSTVSETSSECPPASGTR